MGRPLQPPPHPFPQEPYIGLGRPSTPHGSGWVGKLAKVVGMGLSQNGTYPAHHHSVHCMSCANAASGLRLFAVRHMHRPPPTHRQAQLFECWWHLCKCRGKRMGRPLQPPPHPFPQEPYIGLGRPSTPHGSGWVGKLAKVVGMGLSQNGTYPAHHHSVHCMSCANAASGLRLFAVRHMHRPPPTHKQAQLFECWWHLCKCRGKRMGRPLQPPPHPFPQEPYIGLGRPSTPHLLRAAFVLLLRCLHLMQSASEPALASNTKLDRP